MFPSDWSLFDCCSWRTYAASLRLQSFRSHEICYRCHFACSSTSGLYVGWSSCSELKACFHASLAIARCFLRCKPSTFSWDFAITEIGNWSWWDCMNMNCMNSRKVNGFVLGLRHIRKKETTHFRKYLMDKLTVFRIVAVGYVAVRVCNFENHAVTDRRDDVITINIC